MLQMFAKQTPPDLFSSNPIRSGEARTAPGCDSSLVCHEEQGTGWKETAYILLASLGGES